MRTQIPIVTCDFCRHGGPLSRPEDFTRFGDVDLCKWCSDAAPLRAMESGGHRVTFREGGGWECSCGFNTARRAVQALLILTPARVREALPNVDRATAILHTDGRLA